MHAVALAPPDVQKLTICPCEQEPARALLQRRASSIASPRAGLQGFLRSPRQSLEGTERDRRVGGMPDKQRGTPMPQSSPTMTDATGLVSTLQHLRNLSEGELF